MFQVIRFAEWLPVAASDEVLQSLWTGCRGSYNEMLIQRRYVIFLAVNRTLTVQHDDTFDQLLTYT
ncbi:hypothetical protein DPMN_039114 [Dreissena polymorpha]|uniref:Uncharacterized protein n=1 Tax=Dreissena polymorpha TaxID=45954 RepID=A0A9D4RPA2_DREPO|nr:hypothetical protein DPMN_039071 [Dreissena polymorpha]KAH3875834.1 hypothetical protein DPMN_039114 [Dreissena polymorpha]